MGHAKMMWLSEWVQVPTSLSEERSGLCHNLLSKMGSFRTKNFENELVPC